MMFAKCVFLMAGVWGVLIIGLNFFNERWVALNDPPPLSRAEFFYGFNAVALASDLISTALERSQTAPEVDARGDAGRIRLVFFFSFTDLVLGILFVVAYIKTPVEA